MDKLGSYISKLMITVLDKEQEEFVKDLALSELTRLNVDVNDFIRKHTKDDFDKAKEKEKQLLQEDKKMSKISKEGYEQIQVIKNALDSMFDKLEAKKVFDSVKDEFEAIAGIVELSGTWEEVE